MKTSNSKIKIFDFFYGGGLIATALMATALIFAGCKQPASADKPVPHVDVGSFEDAGDFIKIIPPVNGIAGVEPDYDLPGTGDDWKGVFRAGRKVKLSPYKLGKTEVTYKLWKEVYDWAKGNGYTFANKGYKGSDRDYSTEVHPVTCVSWRDCIVWCNAYTQMKAEGKADTECVYRKKDEHTVVLKNATDTASCDAAYADMTKKGFRLPTEAEWEYAARWQGSDKTNAAKYGNVWLTKLDSASGATDKWNSAETEKVAWYNNNAKNNTNSVGKKRKNTLCLHDMSGNVWEWCFDWHNNDPTLNDSAYIKGGIVINPQGAASGSERVSRGGGCLNGQGSCAVGYLGNSSPQATNIGLGFRLAWHP